MRISEGVAAVSGVDAVVTPSIPLPSGAKSQNLGSVAGSRSRSPVIKTVGGVNENVGVVFTVTKPIRPAAGLKASSLPSGDHIGFPASATRYLAPVEGNG